MNKKNIAGLLLLATAPALAVGLFLTHGQGAIASSETSTVVDEGTSVNSDLAGDAMLDRERIALLDKRLAALEVMLRQNDARPIPLVEMEARRARDAQASQQRAREQRQGLEARFATTPGLGAKDRQVADSLSRNMGDATLMRNTDPPLTDDIACRGNLCRMQFVFADPMAADNWANFYPLAIAQSLGRTSIYTDANPDGTVSVLMFGQKR